MADPRIDRLMADVAAGRRNRRQVLAMGLSLGLATPVLEALWHAAPSASASPAAPVKSPFPAALQGQSTGTLTIVRDGSSPNIDPHSAYDNLSSMLFLGLYEMLVRYKGSATDEVEAMLAESWQTSEDGKAVTFKIAPNALFHDGSACDAQAVKDSFTRFIGMDTGPVAVVTRFMSTAEQMEVVDPTTIVFNLDRPSPLFLPAMASEYGPLVVNPRMVEENKTEEIPGLRSGSRSMPPVLDRIGWRRTCPASK